MKKITDIAKTTKVQWRSLAGPVDDNFTELEQGKLSKNELAQSTGNSTTTAMSQDATTKAIKAVKDNLTHTNYITCSTASSTANKTINILGFTLSSRVRLLVKMTKANTADNANLSISSPQIDTKPLYYNDERASSTNSWEAGAVLDIYYDGTNFQATDFMGGAKIETDSELSESSENPVQNKVVTKKLTRLEDNITTIEQNTPYVGHLSCSTAGNLADKSVTILNLELTTKFRAVVRMVNANTANDVNLSISSPFKTTKPLYYKGNRASASNTWSAGTALDIYYDGTNFQATDFMGDTDLKQTIGSDTKSAMSQDATTKALSGLLPGQKASDTPFITKYINDGDGGQIWESFNRELNETSRANAADINGVIRYYLSGLRVDVVNRVVDSSTGSRRLTQVVTGNLFVNDSGDLAFDGNVDQSFNRLYADGAWGDWTPLASGGFAGVPEALADGNTYGRKNKGWVKTIGRSGTGNSAETFNNTSNTASGNYAHAEGDATNASGYAAHAEGQKTKATGYASHAEGGSTEPNYQTHAEGKFAHAEGNRTHAKNDASHAEGYATLAEANCAHAEGNGTTASGIASHAEGYLTTATGLYGHAEGNGTTANGQAAHAEGNMTKTGECSTYDSNYNTISTSGNNYGHAEGNNTSAGGLSSHAEGEGGNAFGRASHAEGQSGAAIGLAAHSEGELTMACGEASHTEGQYTQAGTAILKDGKIEYKGTAAHAEGYQTKALGNHSHAEGYATMATNPNEHAQGIYNVSHEHYLPELATAFSIGFGNSEGARKNAVEVMKNGDVYIFGIGGYDGSNIESAKTIQTVISELAEKNNVL